MIRKIQLIKGGAAYPRITAYVDMYKGGSSVWIRVHVPRWIARRLGWLVE